MIIEISIRDTASYGSDAQHIKPCKQVNYIYGANGAGKTTISRVINNPDSFPNCGIVWSNGREVSRYVYNCDFIKQNYRGTLDGIFTLGESSKELLDAIEKAKNKAQSLASAIAAIRSTLRGQDDDPGKEAELKALRSSFDDTCWQIKQRHDEAFQNIFQGLRASRTAFADKLLYEFEHNQSPLGTIEQLKEKSAIVYKSGTEIEDLIEAPDFTELKNIEADPTLATRIVGKGDVNLAGLIAKLNSSDWVSAGRAYWDRSKPHCPFCQEEVTADLSKSLEDYFDEEFTAQIKALDSITERYQSQCTAASQSLEGLITKLQPYFNSEQLADIEGRLNSILSSNRARIKEKRKEPTLSIKLEQVRDVTDEIERLVREANELISKQNVIKRNITDERKTLSGSVWKFIIEENRSEIEKYLGAKAALDRAIGKLSARLSECEKGYSETESELARLQRKTTSAQPTVIEINSLLKSFGFTNFKLKTAGEHDHLYKLIRHDGTDASDTLSEGERTFITFLYFYQLVRGSKSPEGVLGDRIVVIDDPVASLDSDVLFIVSTLIRSLVEEATQHRSNIRQVFVLTHNVYFHKEITFDRARNKECKHFETFWIVRRGGASSTITNYNYNPIKTSYELLWAEVRKATPASSTIHNTLRRIIENYFKILGGINPSSIIDLFEGRDKQICASLFSWVNDGSHSVYDDLYVAMDEGVVEVYLRVFRSIFDKSKHSEHYNMMMGLGQNEDLSENSNPKHLDRLVSEAS